LKRRFPVIEANQDIAIKAYMEASVKMTAGAVDIRYKNIKTKKIVKVRMIIAPVGFGGHVCTTNFFSKV
jgi:hypothetical protein